MKAEGSVKEAVIKCQVCGRERKVPVQNAGQVKFCLEHLHDAKQAKNTIYQRQRRERLRQDAQKI